jgi:hypothetical protein
MMDTRKQPLLSRIVARLSSRSVPVDGTYWFDSAARLDADAVHRQSAHGRIPPLVSQPLPHQRRVI